MRHSMFPCSSGHKGGLFLRSHRISCKCLYLGGERTRAVLDPAAHYRYGARLPRFLVPFVWCVFRCHSIPPEYLLLEHRRSWEQPEKVVQHLGTSVLVGVRLSGPSARLSFFARIARIAEAY